MQRKTLIVLTVFLIFVGLPCWLGFSGLLRLRRNAQLLLSVKKGDLVSADLLLKQGSDLNSRDYNEPVSNLDQINQPSYYTNMGRGYAAWGVPRRPTALQRSISLQNENLNMERLLLTYGADVNLGDENGVTPLMIAAWYDHIDTMKLLIQHGAMQNVADQNGVTALMMAAGNGSLQAARLLVYCGADPRQKDSMGQSAQDKADMAGKSALSQYLKSVGSKLSHQR